MFRLNKERDAGLRHWTAPFATRGSWVRIPSAPFPPQEAKPMNTMTARALMVGVLIAIWAWLASVARLNVSMWAGVVALGCFYASGGGVAGLQKTIVATVSGVVWVLIAQAVRVAIAGHELPDAVDPRRVLRLHEHGAQAGDRVPVALHPRRGEIEERNGQLGEREVQPAPRRLGEEPARQLGRLARPPRARRPHQDVELRRKRRQEPRIHPQLLVQPQCGGATLTERLGERAARHKGEESLRGP